MMIAVGMCLVIATGGIDLSVGSVMVVSGAVSMEFLQQRRLADSVGAAFAAFGLALARQRASSARSTACSSRSSGSSRSSARWS